MKRPSNEFASRLVGLGLPLEAAENLARAYPKGAGLATANATTIWRAAGCKRAPPWLPALQAALSFASPACEERPAAINNDHDAAPIIRGTIGDLSVESFVVLTLNARQAMIDAVVVAVGSVSCVRVLPREVFRAAVRGTASTIVLGHNHPAGDPSPSAADVDLTNRMVDAGGILCIPVVDHIIVTATSHFSMASAGYLAPGY